MTKKEIINKLLSFWPAYKTIDKKIIPNDLGYYIGGLEDKWVWANSECFQKYTREYLQSLLDCCINDYWENYILYKSSQYYIIIKLIKKYNLYDYDDRMLYHNPKFFNGLDSYTILKGGKLNLSLLEPNLQKHNICILTTNSLLNKNKFFPNFQINKSYDKQRYYHQSHYKR